MQQLAGVELSKIKQIELLAASRPNTVSLAQGIPSFDTPKEIKKATITALNAGRVAKYSLAPGLIELRELIEGSLAEEGSQYDAQSEIIVTAGSIEAISSTMLALLEPLDEVILFSPSYVSYNQSIRLAGAKPVYVALDEASGWQFDKEAFLAALNKKTKAVLICNPNNPTGTIFDKQQLLAIAEIAYDRGIYIIMDEVYKDFLYEEDKTSLYSLTQEVRYRDLVIRIYSFSKAFSMTGWRVGYLVAAEQNARKILAVHDALVTCAPVISQYAAIKALEMPRKAWLTYLNEYKGRRNLMYDHLNRISALHFTVPSAAYFFFPRVNATRIRDYHNSEMLSLALLQVAGVAVVPGAAFGPSGEHHLRLSFGRDRTTINEGMKRLSDFFAAYAL
ncbi:hypothetical protein COV04_02465 [Candidatus Uhrbacteria bacterium CG10_big_fil_rev_8_21_14_0_10_48_11]|uniref:Aminotransferase n=1 Tax=Candidatus Uhrbacteria bacterium CG10_big_fil_rev_8_21_14_0_10_48_11 TaxID=1975037 RepID=A0A2M8LEB9_9BACT|nr:MAG: hypothetical protein COV04_02465 [Candidatus Uhrbacteria bacterium CG10_big_fil_rev_8_21_14_0_10_48_11]